MWKLKVTKTFLPFHCINNFPVSPSQPSLSSCLPFPLFPMIFCFYVLHSPSALHQHKKTKCWGREVRYHNLQWIWVSQHTFFFINLISISNIFHVPVPDFVRKVKCHKTRLKGQIDRSNKKRAQAVDTFLLKSSFFVEKVQNNLITKTGFQFVANMYSFDFLQTIVRNERLTLSESVRFSIFISTLNNVGTSSLHILQLT